MKKLILVYEKDREVLRFLRSFFKEKKNYNVQFINKDEDMLSRGIRKKKPDAVIVNSPEGLKNMNPAEVPCPIIAVVSRNGVGTRGIHSAIKSNVDCYLLSPFHKQELDHKLRELVDRKSLFEILSKEDEDLYSLVEFVSSASSTLNPKEVLYLIVKKISEIIKVTRCSMISINIGNQRYAEVVSSFEDPGLTNLQIDLGKYPEIRRALSSKKMIVIKDAQTDPLMKEVRNIIRPLGIRSIIVVPVIFRDEVIGTLLLRTSRAGRAFTKSEIRLCVALASASSNALYNAFLYERLDREKTRLEKLAITDYLTGIYNIRYFYNRLEEEFSRGQRYMTPLGCIMLDIDHFKKINDTYGHRIGDLVLRGFAQLVKRHTRKSDLFARYGGEEFILLLPQTNLNGAYTEAERLQKIVKEHRFKPLNEGHMVTASFGIACSPHIKIKSSEDLIHMADTALFKAKGRGRDQIVPHSAP